MNRGWIKPSLLLTVLLGALTFLFVQAQTIDASEQNRIIIRIQDVIYKDALVNESVLKSRAGRFSNYDSLARYKEKIQGYLEWFQRLDSGFYGAYGSDLDNAINNTAERFEEKFALTERFKSHNGLLKNSLYYLPVAIKRHEANSIELSHQLELDRLLREVLLYNSTYNNENKAAAIDLMDTLKATGSQNLLRLVLHAEKVIEEKAKLEKYVDDLFDIPTKQAIDEMYQLYSQYSTEKLDRASAYRAAMYAMALVLLVYVLHLFLTLRQTMRCLKDSLGELAFQKHALDEHAIVAIMDSSKTITYVNDKFSHISQFQKKEIVGKRLVGISAEDSPMPFFSQMSEALTDGQSWKGETLSKKKDGSHYWVNATIVPFLDAASNPLKYVALLTDITAKKKAEAEQELVQSELRLAASVFSKSPMAIMIIDSNGTILRVNDAFSTITGFLTSEAVGQSIQFLKSGSHDNRFFSRMLRSLVDTGQWEGEIWKRRKDGDDFPVWSNITAIRNVVGTTNHYISSFSDISEKKIIEDRIFHLAHYDALTNLPNRAFFLKSVEQAREKAAGSASSIAVLFLDLDNFKMVNDTLGHARGDALLKDVAEKLLACVRESDLVARLGGDEFVIALRSIQSRNQIEEISQKILALTRVSLCAGEKEILVSTSIGISIFPDDGADVETLITHADTAMYCAKADGKSKYQFFHEAMNIGIPELDAVESKLYTSTTRQ